MNKKMQRFIWTLIFVLCLTPFLILVYSAFNNQLGANPIEEVTHVTGEWGLNFLMITLAITPLRKVTGWSLPVRFRRMLGLYAFFYACLHVICYIVLDHFFDWQTIIEDIVERPYITVGFSAFVLLIPLAITSTKKMVMRMGKKWKQLHKMIYLICLLAILHYLWLVKADITVPAIYAVVFFMLMVSRSKYFSFRKPSPSPPQAR